MTVRGRKPAPTKLRLVAGRAPGRDSGGRILPPTPPFARYAPDKPEELEGEASKHWDLLVPELARLDLITPQNLAGLVMLCELWARWQEALIILREEGVLGENAQGVVRHPALAVATECSREYRQWAGEFGLTPSAEGRLGIKDRPQTKEANPFSGEARA